MVATVASPTVVVEPEKPAEETAAEDKATADTTLDGAEKPTEEAKDQDTKAKDQSKKVAEGKKEDKTKK